MGLRCDSPIVWREGEFWGQGMLSYDGERVWTEPRHVYISIFKMHAWQALFSFVSVGGAEAGIMLSNRNAVMTSNQDMVESNSSAAWPPNCISWVDA